METVHYRESQPSAEHYTVEPIEGGYLARRTEPVRAGKDQLALEIVLNKDDSGVWHARPHMLRNGQECADVFHDDVEEIMEMRFMSVQEALDAAVDAAEDACAQLPT